MCELLLLSSLAALLLVSQARTVSKVCQALALHLLPRSGGAKSVLVPRLCLLLQDVFTCFSPVITITQPAHQAQRQDEPSSCLGKRICSRQVVCCSICCFVIQLLEQRKERDGYKNGQCQLLFIPCHLDNLPAVLLHVYSQLFTALSVALFPLLIYSFLWRGQPHFSAE